MKEECMSEEMTQKMMAAAERLATAAEALDRVLERIDAQQEALNAKVDRIVAAVEEQLTADEAVAGGESLAGASLQNRVAELEKVNADLKAQAARMTRKTLPAAVSVLIGKFDGASGERFDAEAIEKTLQPLSVEQRIAVKAEMARAGFIE
jgi:predicted RNase H-like nuclease (RuvC/YqgF family)